MTFIIVDKIVCIFIATKVIEKIIQTITVIVLTNRPPCDDNEMVVVVVVV